MAGNAYPFINHHHMKLKALILSLLAAIGLNGQDLPVNRSTRLVSITDTIQLNSISVKDFKAILGKWQNYLNQKANLENIFSLKSKDESVSLSFGGFLFHSSAETQKNIYTNSGSLTYFGYKRDPVFKEAASRNATNGKVTFTFTYSIKDGEFIYEFTNFEYGGYGTSGKFEDDKPVKPFASGVLAQNKKRWAAIKIEYFDRFKTISAHLKNYVIEYLTSMKADSISTSSKSLINYESYKQITPGMTLDEVRKILGDDGKEVSSSTTQVNNKSVLLQTIIWGEKSQSKSILISFTDNKVSSKSQTNL